MAMYVCVCRAVSDREIKAAIEAGADTVAAVTAACCAGDDCGACHGVIEELIDERQEATRSPVTHLPVVRERAA
jgi:bacterioferritin-associated ferredoxin